MNHFRIMSGASLITLGMIIVPTYADTRDASVSSSQAPSLCITRPGGAVAPASLEQWAEGAQLFDRLGTYRRRVTTGSREAQAYFDQGMRFLWAFNHDESTRSFAKAAQLDPNCALCCGGVALTGGPNYNLPMMAEPRADVAFEAVQQAQAKAAAAQPVEKALIAALVARYPSAQPLDPATEGAVLTAYAARMGDVAKAYLEDADVQTLAAEAMMTANAWKLWALDGTPAEGTLQIIATLEGV